MKLTLDLSRNIEGLNACKTCGGNGHVHDRMIADVAIHCEDCRNGTIWHVCPVCGDEAGLVVWRSGNPTILEIRMCFTCCHSWPASNTPRALSGLLFTEVRELEVAV